MKPDDENRVTLSKNAKDCFGNPLAHLTYNLTEEDRKMLVGCRELTLEIFRRLGVHVIREAAPAYSRHHIGTCRMGDNPTTSVVDRNLRVHECPNLYIGGSETFVTGGAVGPVLTIVALAHRLAEQLDSRLRLGQF